MAKTCETLFTNITNKVNEHTNQLNNSLKFKTIEGKFSSRDTSKGKDNYIFKLDTPLPRGSVGNIVWLYPGYQRLFCTSFSTFDTFRKLQESTYQTPSMITNFEFHINIYFNNSENNTSLIKLEKTDTATNIGFKDGDIITISYMEIQN